MEDAVILFLNGRQPHLLLIEDDLNIFLQVEDNLNNLVNGRRPPKLKNQTMQPKTHKSCLLCNFKEQLLPGSLTNTKTKNILAQLKNQTKSTLISCDIIVN